MALSDHIDSKEGGITEYNSDTIVGFSAGVDSNSQQGWVFVGTSFDYMLTGGGDKIVAVLKSEYIDRHDFNIFDVGQFYISKDKKHFSGNIRLRYKINHDLNTDKTRDTLIANGFRCDDGSKIEICETSLGNLQGSIHAKNKKQDNSQILTFYHPFTVTFYADNGLSAARALYPITIVTDVVTSPLQLIGGTVFWGRVLVGMGQQGTK